MLKKSSNQTNVTMVKKHDKRDTLVIRLYNMTSNNISESLVLGLQVQKAWRINLLEERESEIEVREGAILDLKLSGCEIAGVEVQFCKI